MRAACALKATQPQQQLGNIVRTLLLVLLLISWLLLILGMHDAHILKEVAGQRAPQLPAGLQGSNQSRHQLKEHI